MKVIEINLQKNKIIAATRNFIINDQKNESYLFSYARKSGFFLNLAVFPLKIEKLKIAENCFLVSQAWSLHVKFC